MNKLGLSLIEVMLSLFLSMTLLITMNRIWVSLVSLNHVTNQHENIVQLAIALTRWAADVRSADQVVVMPGVTENSQCILKLQDTYCGWFVKKGKLMRYAGTYSLSGKEWSHLSTSLLMGSLEKVRFRYFTKGMKVVCIEACFIRNERNTLKLTCAV